MRNRERDYTEEVEEMCRRFNKATGLMCPGKDVPAAMGGGDAAGEERWCEWKKWLKTQKWVRRYR